MSTEQPEMAYGTCKCRLVQILLKEVDPSSAQLEGQIEPAPPSGLSYEELDDSSIIIPFPDSVVVKPIIPSVQYSVSCMRCHRSFRILIKGKSAYAALPKNWIRDMKTSYPISPLVIKQSSSIPQEILPLFGLNECASSPVILSQQSASGDSLGLLDGEYTGEPGGEDDDSMMFSNSSNCVVGSFVESPLMDMMGMI